MAHSYSSWSTYNKCAARYRYAYLDRLPGDPPSPQMERGTRIHESLEKYFLGEAKRLDKEVHAQNGLYVSQIKGVHDPEWKWGLTKKLEPTDFDAQDAYVRGVIDLRTAGEASLHLHEWKTGKMYEEHADQGHLYGMVGLLDSPVETVKVTVRYLDFGTGTDFVYPQSELKMMQARWKDRFKKMDRDKTFAPNPSYLCRWCPYNRDRGGPCKVG